MLILISLMASLIFSGAGTLGFPKLKSYTLSAPYCSAIFFPSSNIARMAELFCKYGFIFSAIMVMYFLSKAKGMSKHALLFPVFCVLSIPVFQMGKQIPLIQTGLLNPSVPSERPLPPALLYPCGTARSHTPFLLPYRSCHAPELFLRREAHGGCFRRSF